MSQSRALFHKKQRSWSELRYRENLKQNLFEADKDLGLGRGSPASRTKALNNQSKLERLRLKHIHKLEWSSQSADLNLIKSLWHDLKYAVHDDFVKTTWGIFFVCLDVQCWNKPQKSISEKWLHKVLTHWSWIKMHNFKFSFAIKKLKK